MTPELETRIAIAQKYGNDPRPEVRNLAQVLREQIRAARDAPDSEVMRETIELSFQRLRAAAGE
jgi:hypothetical protein